MSLRALMLANVRPQWHYPTGCQPLCGWRNDPTRHCRRARDACKLSTPRSSSPTTTRFLSLLWLVAPRLGMASRKMRQDGLVM